MLPEEIEPQLCSEDEEQGEWRYCASIPNRDRTWEIIVRRGNVPVPGGSMDVYYWRCECSGQEPIDGPPDAPSGTRTGAVEQAREAIATRENEITAHVTNDGKRPDEEGG